MKYDSKNAHYIAVTGIVVNRGKYLIVQRSPNDKVFPGRWKVPGGKLDSSDYLKRRPDFNETTTPGWNNILERVLEREIKEETGIKVRNIKYLTNIVFIRPDKVPALVVSLHAKYRSGKVNLNSDLTNFAWVSLKEAKSYKLVGGIYKELAMVDKLLRKRGK